MSLPERGDGEFVRFFARARKADRDCNIEPQRHITPSCEGLTPTADRTVGSGKDVIGELDTQTRN